MACTKCQTEDEETKTSAPEIASTLTLPTVDFADLVESQGA